VVQIPKALHTVFFSHPRRPLTLFLPHPAQVQRFFVRIGPFEKNRVLPPLLVTLFHSALFTFQSHSPTFRLALLEPPILLDDLSTSTNETAFFFPFSPPFSSLPNEPRLGAHTFHRLKVHSLLLPPIHTTEFGSRSFYSRACGFRHKRNSNSLVCSASSPGLLCATDCFRGTIPPSARRPSIFRLRNEDNFAACDYQQTPAALRLFRLLVTDTCVPSFFLFDNPRAA
jgi:hypothetical protein